MSDARLTPVGAVFGDQLDARFAPIAEGLASAGTEPRDRDAFVLVREVVELLRELVPPEEASPVAVAELVAFVHAAYLYWVDGQCRVRVARPTLERRLGLESARALVAPTVARSYYLELPSQRVWGEAVAGGPAEPLDGCFIQPRDGWLSVVGIFGLHPSREGLTIVDAGGARDPGLVRMNGTALFSPQMAGGASAGLFQVTGNQELVELGYRFHEMIGPAGAMPGEQWVALP